MQVKQNISYYQGIFSSIGISANSFWLYTIVVAAVISFFCTLGLPSVGEEGVYTNITLEMLHSKNYLVPTLFGLEYSRPPLFNWLMLPITKIIGAVNVTLAARIVNVLATLASALILYKFVSKKFNDKKFALFCGAVFLSGDLLFKRGWLAYSDSLFALGIFGAIVCLWLALDSKRVLWLCAAVFSLSCAFLAKVHTAYIFYGIAALVLLWKHPNRKYLLSAPSWLLHIAAIAFPLYWTVYISRGHGAVSTSWTHYKSFINWPGMYEYAAKVFLYYPFEVLIRFLPLSLVAIYAWYKPKQSNAKLQNNDLNIVFWIILLNLLPYWLAPVSNIRYILPLYPFITMLIAYQIWNNKKVFRDLAIRLLLFGVVCKFVYAIWWLPYEHTQWRGNASEVARSIQSIVQDAPLYSRDSTASGLRVVVELNKIRYPQAPLTTAPSNYTGYVLLDSYDGYWGELVQTYKLRNNAIYLCLKASPS